MNSREKKATTDALNEWTNGIINATRYRTMHRMYCPQTAARMSPLVVATMCITLAVSAIPVQAQSAMQRHTQRAAVSSRRRDLAGSDSNRAIAHATYSARAIDAATREYRESGVARTVPIGNTVAFPYGHSDPVLTCTVLRVCVVELEGGEQIVNEPIAGDQARWIIEPAQVGPGGRNTLVVVKPKACDITTNLVIPTDRRIYDLTLDSPPCNNHSTNPQRSYVRDIRFYYPDADAMQARDVEDGLSSITGAPGPVTGDPRGALQLTPTAMRADGQYSNTAAPLSFFDRADLNHDYRVKRERRGPFGMFGQKPLDFPWKPTAIVDDGAHVYIKLPPEAKSHAAPVLYAVEDDGSRTMVNYAVREADGVPAYVTDRIFRRGVFVVMSGTKEQHLEFENRAWGESRVPASVRAAVASGSSGRGVPNGGTR